MTCVGDFDVPPLSPIDVTSMEIQENTEDCESIFKSLQPRIKELKISAQDNSRANHSLTPKYDKQDFTDIPIRVVVRKRPLGTQENNRGEKDVLIVGFTAGEVVKSGKSWEQHELGASIKGGGGVDAARAR